MKPVSLVLAVALAGYVIVRRKRFSREGMVFVAIVVAGLIVHGTGAVKLPNFEELIVDIAEGLGAWTYLLVGAMAFAETGAFLGFVAPGEVTVIVGGVIAGQGQIDVIALLAIVWACCVAGDVTSYYLGRRLGRGFLEKHGKRVQITPARLDKVEDYYHRRGGLTILVGRFIGFVRPLSPFLAGSTHMPFRRFIAYDVLAAGLWSTTFVLLGYVFWHSFDKVSEYAKKGALYFGMAVALGLALVWLIRHRKEVEERLMRTRAGRAVRRPLVFAWNRLTPGELGLELTTLLAVAAVGSFVFVGYLIVLQGVSVTPGDIRALQISNDLFSQALVDVAKVMTTIGSPGVTWTIAAIASVWLFVQGRRLEAAVIFIGAVLVIIGVHVTKEAVERPRPPGQIVHAGGWSYPSGHAAYSVFYVAIAVALSRAAPTVRRYGLPLVAVLIVVIVCLTRVYLQAHYLSDVLGGVGFSAACFAVCGVVALIVNFVRHNGMQTT